MHYFTRKSLASLLILALSTLWIPTRAFATGEILVLDCEDLELIGSGGMYTLDANYTLVNNIDCSASSGWNEGRGFTPIGTMVSPFTGTFDGNGRTISDLYIDRVNDVMGEDEGDEHNVGLFGYIVGAQIRNTTITSSRVRGYNNVGGFVGYADTSVLQNLSFNTTSTPNACAPTGDCVWARFGAYGGGILGYGIKTVLSNVSSGGSVKGSGNVIGGIVGYLEAADGVASISYATSTADVDGGTSIGGIAGDLVGVAVSNATASGYINVTNDLDKVGNGGGGLIGTMSGGSISNSHATGNVYGNNELGGLVGSVTETTITNSTATGSVQGSYRIGGFAGMMEGVDVSDSTASGSVDASSEVVGGFAGATFCESYFLRVSASGQVSSYSGYAGGLVGADSCMGVASTFERVSASGLVMSFAGDNVGGLLGHGVITTISKATASGNVEAPNSVNVGGLVGGLEGRGGSNFSSVNESFATGSVTGIAVAGGLIGRVVSNAQIRNSYSRGLVSATDILGGFLGGLEEEADILIEDSYAANEFAEESGAPGGFVGTFAGTGTMTASFWDAERSTVSLTSGFGAVGKTTAQMKSLATFTTDLGGDAWNLTTIWNRKDSVNDGYLCLRWVDGCNAIAPTPTPSATPTASPTPAVDSDGVDISIENTSPNGGDANGDGSLDGAQSNVTSFLNTITGKYAVLQSSCASQSGVGIQAESTSSGDSGYDYPVGLMAFTLSCGTAGTTAQVSQYFFGDYDAASFVARKFFANTAAYVAIPGATFTKVTIGGQSALKLSYSITDGGALDQDGVANGVIVDPAGPATQVVSAPKTGFGTAR